MELHHHRLVAGGVALHFVTTGNGPPLVLIHGFPQTWHQWRRVMERLANRFTIIAPDLRGIGATPGPPSGYDKHSLAADVHAIVTHVCGEQRVLVVGHDMGSFVAFAYALRYRDQVSGLMLVDAPPPGTTLFESGKHRAWHIAFHCARDVAEMLVAGKERAYIAQFVAARIYDSAAVSEEDIDIYAAAYRAPGAMRAAFEMYRSLDQDAELNRSALTAKGRLTMPVVSVAAAGRMNGKQLEEMGTEVAEHLRVILVERAGHWIPEEQPEVLARAIIDLAEEVLR
jgi:pimeloyl-ACP methyl ester carboxylesterase